MPDQLLVFFAFVLSFLKILWKYVKNVKKRLSTGTWSVQHQNMVKNTTLYLQNSKVPFVFLFVFFLFVFHSLCLGHSIRMCPLLCLSPPFFLKTHFFLFLSLFLVTHSSLVRSMSLSFCLSFFIDLCLSLSLSYYIFF